MYCAVLGVDWNDVGVLDTPYFLHEWGGGHERLFVGQCETTTRAESGQRGRQSGESDHGVHCNVGRRRHRCEPLVTDKNSGVRQFARDASGIVLTAHGNGRHAKLSGDRNEFVDASPTRESR